jgi:DNA-binding MarR family transcriptional regulator
MQWNKTDMNGKWISFLYRYLQIFMDEQLKRFGIGSGQFIFLLTLLNSDGVSQESVATSLGIDKGTTAVAMKKLQEKGYIIRKTDRADRRSYRIFVTQKARSIQKEFKEVLSSWTDILTKGFTRAEMKQAADILVRMNDNAGTALREKRESAK